jgi:histone H3/H4
MKKYIYFNLYLLLKMFPFTIKYTNVPIPSECKRFCGLLIPGAVIPGGNKQLCHERVIDNDNIELFTIWCYDNNQASLYKNKVGLDLDTVYKYFYLFDDSETTTIEIIPEEGIPKKAFKELVLEIASELGDYCFEKEALKALQQVAKEHLIKLFNNAGSCAKNANRKTITVEDFNLVSTIQK